VEDVVEETLRVYGEEPPTVYGASSPYGYAEYN